MLTRLSAALASCAQISCLKSSHRIWALKTLRDIVVSEEYKTKFGFNLKSMLAASYTSNKSVLRDRDLSPKRAPSTPNLQPQYVNIPPSVSYKQSHESLNAINCGRRNMNTGEFALINLLKSLPDVLQRQYDYEDPLVRGGKHLMHSKFFKVLVGLACDLNLDQLVSDTECGNQWGWFKRYCDAARTLNSLLTRDIPFPESFLAEVRAKLREIVEEDGECSSAYHESSRHECNQDFSHDHDQQLLLWFKRRPDDWTLSWTGEHYQLLIVICKNIYTICFSFYEIPREE